MDTDELRARLRERAEVIDTERPERLAEVHRRIRETESAERGLMHLLGGSPGSGNASRWSSILDTVPGRALAAAVAVAVALLGIGVLVGRSLDRDGGRPAPGTGPDSHAVTPLPQETGPIPAGRYSLPVGDRPLRALVTVGGGWLANGTELYNETVGLSFETIRAVYRDACPGLSSASISTRGASVAELLTALDRQRGTDLSVPIDDPVDGYPAVRVDLTPSPRPDPLLCSNRRSWTSKGETPGLGDGSDRLWVVDVDGTTVVVDAYFADEQSPHPAVADALVDTVEFQLP